MLHDFLCFFSWFGLLSEPNRHRFRLAPFLPATETTQMLTELAKTHLELTTG